MKIMQKLNANAMQPHAVCTHAMLNSIGYFSRNNTKRRESRDIVWRTCTTSHRAETNTGSVPGHSLTTIVNDLLTSPSPHLTLSTLHPPSLSIHLTNSLFQRNWFCTHHLAYS
mmetsp:Transcript_10286/g.38217  ORF Transcript_10286/g.38217 Transcript_10286/m.38217 type:complete len:113 (+) Transcript_10286:1286-1624(+)